jgi:3-oxoacyl-[acyl-carrier protein] reductase
MINNNVFNFGARTAIVTGGSRNIGLAIAESFLLVGMKVAVIGSTEKSLSSARKTLFKFGANCEFWQCDLSEIIKLRELVSSINTRFGSIDILVNCAGMLESKEIENITEEDWDNVMNLNMKAAFFLMQECLPFLKAGKSARIINVSSNAGRMGGYASGSAYAASKGGLIALTYSLARKLAKFNITVNTIAPGTIESEMSKALPKPELLTTRIPLGRLGKTSEVAAAVCYLASLESSFTTGAVIDVNGGMFMG